jgi:hypothetical protein
VVASDGNEIINGGSKVGVLISDYLQTDVKGRVEFCEKRHAKAQ